MEKENTGMLNLAWKWIKSVLGMCWRLVTDYRYSVWYLLKTKGIRAAYNFVFVKFFARGERVGAKLLDAWNYLFPGLTPYPYMIELEISTKCHLKCTICELTYWPSEEKVTDLSYAQFVHILDQFPGLKYINVTGIGSAFANREFPQMLAELSRRNIYVMICESMTALSDDQIQMLAKHCHKVVFSFDSPVPETYEKIRPPAKFEKVIQNIQRLIQLRGDSPFPELAFRMTFFKDNWHELMKMINLVNALMHGKRYGDDGAVEFVSILEFDKIAGWEVQIPNQMVRNVEDLAKAYKLQVNWAHPEHLAKKDMTKCVVWSEPYILSSGHVLPCCALLVSNRRPFLRANSFGNIFETPFKTIWARTRNFRKLVRNGRGPVPRICSGCRAYETTRREALHGQAIT
jgi:MoaA/NifB/PqqE/SkfB family radical SAM enzyme